MCKGDGVKRFDGPPCRIKCGTPTRCGCDANCCGFLSLQPGYRVSRLVQSQQTFLPWWGERWHVLAFAGFVCCWVVDVQAHTRGVSVASWSSPLAYVMAAVTTLVTVGRQLPIQNVLALAGLCAAVGAGWVAFASGPVTWQMTTVWMVIFLNIRGAAQFILHFRRSARYYGWELIGVIAVLAAFATLIVYGFSAVILITPFVAAGLFLAALPLTLNKRPVEPPVSWQPIVVLSLMLVWPRV